MKCKDCARYPFCSHIHKPTDEACEYAIKRKDRRIRKRNRRKTRELFRFYFNT